MKLSYSKNNGMKSPSECNYFALLWVPSLHEAEHGMEADEFNTFIDALRSAGYFVNKLNKKAVYISGPPYGNIIDRGGDSEEKFDLTALSRTCRGCLDDLPDDIYVDIEVAVHELAREVLSALHIFAMLQFAS